MTKENANPFVGNFNWMQQFDILIFPIQSFLCLFKFLLYLVLYFLRVVRKREMDERGARLIWFEREILDKCLIGANQPLNTLRLM